MRKSVSNALVAVKMDWKTKELFSYILMKITCLPSDFYSKMLLLGETITIVQKPLNI